MTSEYGAPIRVRKTTRDRLKQLGAKDDTYDKIINELIDKTKS